MRKRGEDPQKEKMQHDPSQLYLLCTSQRWNEVLTYLHEHPQEAGKLLNTGKKGASQVSVLQVVLSHSKCQGSVPIKVIDLLLTYAPHLANFCQLYTGNVPLHAVFYNAFFNAHMRKEIAERLLKVSPDASKTKNKDGRTPLHTNCSQHCNFEPILTLLRSAPETASWPDNNGDLPIHLACRSQKSPNKSIIVLFEAFPEGIRMRNSQGKRPIDIAYVCPMNQRKRIARIKLLKSLEFDLNKKNRKRSYIFVARSNNHDLLEKSTSEESLGSESFNDNPVYECSSFSEYNIPNYFQSKRLNLDHSTQLPQFEGRYDEEGEKGALILMNMHRACKL